MGNIVESVSTVAVWGSLLSSSILASFMGVQAAIDRERRHRFGAFALVCLVTLSIDLLFPVIDKSTYEFLRVLAWSLYGPAVVFLFGGSLRISAAFVALLMSGGLACWNFYDRNLATTVVLPASFFVAAAAHLAYFARTRGYASCVLSVVSLCQSLQCAYFYAVVSSGNSTFIALGYLHYTVVTTAGVLFGWVHLTPEIRGQAPVKVSISSSLIFATLFVGAETAVFPMLLSGRQVAVEGAIVAALAQLLTLFCFFFYHRHLLVVFTDNVVALLAQRTASLRKVQEELARQNGEQAKQLEAQAKSLREQSATIERQRRLELAAQTAGQAAHDIQNLVSPLMMYLQLLERKNHPPEDLPELSRKIRSTLADLSELNSQLLTLSRRGQSGFEPLLLNDLLNDIALRFDAIDANVTVQDSLWVDGSWGQLSRAFSNLLLNAHEASGGAPVRVHCSRVSLPRETRCHLGFLSPGTYVLVEIADSGPGIPGEILDRIFEPFFTSKRRGTSSGSGLGLSIVAAVIDDHGGVIDLVTGPEGTTFRIYLPEANEAAARTNREPIHVTAEDPAAA